MTTHHADDDTLAYIAKLEAELAETQRALNSAKMLIKANDKRWEGNGEKLAALKEARDTLQSERDANAVLTAELSAAKQHIRTDNIAVIAALQEELARINEAARAVVERWHTPLWKNVPATAEYINALAKAIGETT